MRFTKQRCKGIKTKNKCKKVQRISMIQGWLTKFFSLQQMGLKSLDPLL